MPPADAKSDNIDPFAYIGDPANRQSFPDEVKNAILAQNLIHAASPHPKQYGRSLLHLAVWENNVPAATFLIEHGANVNQLDDLHDSPFLLSGAEGRLEILRAIVDNAERVSKCSSATEAQRKAATPDFTVVNRFGGSALIPACERGHADVVQLLLERTAIDPNHYNFYDWTGLLEVVELGGDDPDHVRITELLIKHGVDVNQVDGKGKTPLALARRKNLKRICALLEKAGGHE